jgi:hypothetical protein
MTEIILLSLGILGFIMGINTYQKPKSIEEESIYKDYPVYKIDQTQTDNSLRQWERAREFWDKLYYCYRDDVVFIPGTNQSSSPDKLKEYLYSL